MEYKFKLIENEKGFIIKDVKTGHQLDLTSREDVLHLTRLLNDWHSIITDKWGL